MSSGVFRDLSLAALLVGLPCGCRTVGHAAAVGFVVDVALPVDVAATITAAAARAALPFADPMAPTLAAPATPHDDGSFTVCFEQDDAGHWLPRGACRLAIEVPTAVDQVVGVRREDDPCPGFGARASHRFTVQIQAGRVGARIAGELPPAAQRAVTQALQLAVDPDATTPGLAEPNLGAFVGHRLWQAARRAAANGDDTGARALLQRAARLPGAPAPLLGELAHLAGDAGDFVAANDLGLLAVAAARDPLQRSQLAHAVAEHVTNHQSPAGLRRLADERLRHGDLAGAERLLHTARRLDPRPTEDYQLLSRLQERRPDGAAWATTLLAEEHARAATPSAPPPRFDLARPMLAIDSPHRAAASTAAAPAR